MDEQRIKELRETHYTEGLNVSDIGELFDIADRLTAELAAEKKRVDAAVGALNSLCEPCVWERGGSVCRKSNLEKCRVVTAWLDNCAATAPDGAEGEAK